MKSRSPTLRGPAGGVGTETQEEPMKTSLMARAALAGALVLTTLGAATGDASAKANTQLEAEGTLVDQCGDNSSLFTIEMSGNLVGCWYTDDLVVTQETPSGIYQERGTETFVGCLVDDDGVELACGSFSTTYKYTGKFAPDGTQYHGRCQHPIVAGSGTGGFMDATGRIDMKDDVVNGVFNVHGHLKLDG